MLMVAPGDGNLVPLAADDRYVGGSTTMKLKILRDYASLEINGREVWSGRHALGPGNNARYAGVRLLARGQLAEVPIVVKQMRLLTALQR